MDNHLKSTLIPENDNSVACKNIVYHRKCCYTGKC